MRVRRPIGLDQVSNFVCGRKDWPFLASMYMCLWKEVADKLGDADRRCLDARQHLVEVLESFHSMNGFAPHPYTLVRQAGLKNVGSVGFESASVFRRPSAASAKSILRAARQRRRLT